MTYQLAEPTIETLLYQSAAVAQWFSEGSTVEHSLRGYRVSKHPSGKGVIVHGLELFRPVQRFNQATKKVDDFGETYCRDAIQNFSERRADGYLPPVHTKHIPKGGSATAENRFAGYLDRVYEDRDKEGFLVRADMWVVDPQIFQEIVDMKLPYRSVEILDPSKAEFSSLALLDYNVPYFKFPVTRVDVQDAKQLFAEDERGAVNVIQQFAFPADMQGGDEMDGPPIDEGGPSDEELLAMLEMLLGEGDEMGMDTGMGDMGMDMEGQMAGSNKLDELATLVAAKVQGAGGATNAPTDENTTAPPLAASQATATGTPAAQDFAQLQRQVKALTAAQAEDRKTIAKLNQFVAAVKRSEAAADFAEQIDEEAAPHVEKLVQQFQLSGERQNAVLADYLDWRDSYVRSAVQQFSQGQQSHMPDVAAWVGKWQSALAGSTVTADDTPAGVMPAQFAQSPSDANSVAAAVQFCENDADAKAVFSSPTTTNKNDQAKVAAYRAAREYDNDPSLRVMCSREAYIRSEVNTH